MVLQEADDAVEDVDPADTWPQMESWLQSRISYELLANYTLLRDAGRRAQRGGRPSTSGRRPGEVFDQLAVYNPTPLVSGTAVEHKIELEKMKAGKQAMVALKSAYGGALMFTMLGAHDRHRARPDQPRHRPGDGPQGTAGREEAPAARSGAPRPATRCAATATRSAS